MSEDESRWAEINGGSDVPPFTWTASTGDRTEELRKNQFKEGEYGNRAWVDRGWGIPFGRHQMAAVTMGGMMLLRRRTLSSLFPLG